MTKKREMTGKVIVELNEELVAIFNLTELPGDKGTEIDSLINPELHLPKLKELLHVLGDHAEASYYTSRVKFLSKEAREAIKRALDGEDTSSAPF